MSRELLSYLDDLPCGSIQSSAEYAYLGHFRQHQYLDQGHNELRMEQQIEAGDIPDIHGGSNTPADAAPGAESGTNELNAGQAAGGSQSSGSSGMGSGGGGPASRALKSAFGVEDSPGGPASAIAGKIIGSPEVSTESALGSDYTSGSGLLGLL